MSKEGIIKKCCGRKPINYKRGTLGRPYLFCALCYRAYSLEGEQIENWFYRKTEDSFVKRTKVDRL